jgi:hypothetical protein
VNDRNRWRSAEAHRIVGEYHATGNTFDGIYRNLLPRLRENRRVDPETMQTEGLLRTVRRVTNNRFSLSAVPFPHLILDAEVLVSIDVHELERDTATVLAALDIEDRPDIAHTALLALSYRCVVATLEPGAYHRLGYLRTVDLS